MDYNKAIESVCFKFGHAVTEYDVFRWLRNFDESEWTMALNVLDKVVYYSSDMIDETLEYQINIIIEENPGQHIYILPSGNVGKSGHAMAYHAKKVIEKLNLPESVLSLLNLKNLKDIKKNAVIALLDDETKIKINLWVCGGIRYKVTNLTTTNLTKDKIMEQPLMLQSDCVNCKFYEGFGQCYLHGNNLIENCKDYQKGE